MNLINQTPYSTLLFRTALKKDRLAASAMIRATYDVSESGNAKPVSEQILPLSEEQRESEFGPIEHDMVFRRGGVDLFVFGHAISRNRKPVQQMEVRVRFGGQVLTRLMVFGDRYWKSTAVDLSISQPEPFVRMPVSLFNAFGGKANWDGLDIPHQDNPYGKGFYLSKEEAAGKPLPNIEDPGHLISNWNDKPDPVGIVHCPLSRLRMAPNVEFKENRLHKINPRFFNAAFPQMVLGEVKPGDQITVEGFTQSGIFTFTIPQHDLYMNLRLGNKVVERPLYIDQIGIFPGLKKAFITYRYPFRYVFIALQERDCTLFERHNN